MTKPVKFLHANDSTRPDSLKQQVSDVEDVDGLSVIISFQNGGIERQNGVRLLFIRNLLMCTMPVHCHVLYCDLLACVIVHSIQKIFRFDLNYFCLGNSYWNVTFINIIIMILISIKRLSIPV